MDPITTGQLINGASHVLAAALGGGGPAAPSNAVGGYADGQAYNASPYDGSNWTVATGKSTATGGLHWNWIVVGAIVAAGVLYLHKKGKL